MKSRQTPLSIRNKPVYFRHTLQDKGEHVFASPFPAISYQLQPAVIHFAQYMQLASEAADLSQRLQAGEDVGVDLDVRLALISERAMAFYSAMAAFIGFYWYHPTLELETSTKAFPGDVMSYGESVLNELWEDGYSELEITALAAVCFRDYSSKQLTNEVLEERRSFLGVNTESSI